MVKRQIAFYLMLTALSTAPAMAAETKSDAQTAVQTEAITTQSPDQWRASKLIGLKVLDPAEKGLGSISDILVDHSGNAQFVVIGVGGFLGIGEKDVAVPFKDVKWVSHEEAAAAAASKAPETTPRTGMSAAPGTTGATAPAASPPRTGTTAAAPGTTGGATAPPAKPATDASLGYPDHAVISMTKDELKNAPSFHYAGASSK